jgi:hypothetical protein
MLAFPEVGEVTVTVSAYVFGANPANAVGFTVKVMACGLVPLAGDTVRKLGPPLIGAALTVNGRAVLELVTCTV